MTLIDVIGGTCGGSATLRLVGIAYSFTSRPTFWPSGDSDQSTNLRAASRLRAPLMIATDPTS
jgi:hypothetical protein